MYIVSGKVATYVLCSESHN